ncbi:MAG: hypothetical protein P1U56_21090 [Saprospiraceae bacterium]|nr:hypothetical protein [Saprospiraceae bacterium]
MRYLFLFALLIPFVSCKKKAPSFKKTVIAQVYYEGRNHNAIKEVCALIKNKISIDEQGVLHNYTTKEYENHLRWESVFNPVFKMLDIKQEGKVVKATISTRDMRTKFLHKKPIVTKELIHFKDGFISKVEISEYVDVEHQTLKKNQDDFLTWINENHPELAKSMMKKSVKGAEKYLEALQIYKRNN